MSKGDDKAWHERYAAIIQRIIEYDEANGEGLLTYRKLPTSTDKGFSPLRTNRGVKFLPLDQRTGKAGEDYFAYLNENCPDNPTDSYLVICNNNPVEPKLPPKTEFHFGHTWMHLHASGSDQVIQLYTSFDKTNPERIRKFWGPTLAPAVAGAAFMAAGQPLIGAISMLASPVASVYLGAPPAAPISLHGQKSFHNALIIPLRRRQAEIMRVDTEIDKTGELLEYNFTNTIGRYRTDAGNCTSDAMLRLEHVGLPISKAIQKATSPYEGKDFWWNRDGLWGVDARPGRLGRAFKKLDKAKGGKEYEVNAKSPDDEPVQQETTFKFEECELPMSDGGKSLQVVRILAGCDHDKPVPVWHNPADVMMELQEQCGVFVNGGSLSNSPNSSEEKYVEGLKRTSVAHNKENLEQSRRAFDGGRTVLDILPNGNFKRAVIAERSHPDYMHRSLKGGSNSRY